VILIIGILAAVAIPTFLSQKNKAYSSNVKSDLKSAQTIVEAFATGNGGNYPVTSGSTGVLLSAPTTLPNDSDSNGLTNVYISSNSASADTYELWENSPNSNSVYYISVVAGVAYYGSNSYTTAPAATTAPVTLGSTTGSTTGWTS
jgi:type II secretory pathway pseudopilin PulG